MSDDEKKQKKQEKQEKQEKQKKQYEIKGYIKGVKYPGKDNGEGLEFTFESCRENTVIFGENKYGVAKEYVEGVKCDSEQLGNAERTATPPNVIAIGHSCKFVVKDNNPNLMNLLLKSESREVKVIFEKGNVLYVVVGAEISYE